MSEDEVNIEVCTKLFLFLNIVTFVLNFLNQNETILNFSLRVIPFRKIITTLKHEGNSIIVCN